MILKILSVTTSNFAHTAEESNKTIHTCFSDTVKTENKPNYQLNSK